jgi:hypothetical protein
MPFRSFSPVGGDLLPTNIVSPFDPRIYAGGAFGVNANESRGIRVVCRQSGTLTDMAIFVGVQSGNIDVGVYSVASPRARLFHTGSIACPAANVWTIVGQANVPVTAGQQLDFAISADNATASFLSMQAASGTVCTMPTNFWAYGTGVTPYILWLKAANFPLAASITDASLSGSGRPIFIIGRIQ